MAGLTLKQLRDLLDYYPNKGYFTWKVDRTAGIKAGDVAGTKDKDGYIVIRVLGNKYKAHRLAWFYYYEKWPDKEIDHINRIRDDNRIGNLREVDRYMQNANASRNMEHVGVRWDEVNQRYTVSLGVAGRYYRKAFPIKRYGEDTLSTAIQHRKYLEEIHLCQH